MCWRALFNSLGERGLTDEEALSILRHRVTMDDSEIFEFLHWRVVCTTASQPNFVRTPTWTGSKMEWTEDPMRSTQTLLQSLRRVSPTATGRRELLGGP